MAVSLTVSGLSQNNNISLSIGDTVYALNIQTAGDDESNNTIDVVDYDSYQYIGIVSKIEGDVITANSDIPTDQLVGKFLLFSKNAEVNRAGIKGYYADVRLRNNTTKRAELFAVSSETSQSSK